MSLARTTLILTITIFSLSHSSFCLDPKFVQREWDGVSFASYSWNGNPVWSDSQKSNIIASFNSFSTNTFISDSDFISVFPSSADLRLLNLVTGLPLRGVSQDGSFLKKESVLDILNDKTLQRKTLVKALRERRNMVQDSMDVPNLPVDSVELNRLSQIILILRSKLQ